MDLTMFPEITGDATPAFSNMSGEFDAWVDRRMHFERQKAEAESALAQMGIIMPIDEIAVMVYDEHQEYHLVEGAVRNGHKMFNAAMDSVDTFPIASHYEVHYTFLQHDDSPFRLEIMRLESGCSPLHGTLAALARRGAHGDLPVVVHASFKVKSLAQLGDVEQVLSDNEFVLAQSCRSTYGAFSYWRPAEHFGDTGLEIYLKPRVNLRDAR